MELKENLKALRKTKKMNQHELAKISGLSYSMVCKLESGEQKNPSLDTLQKIADALQVTTSELLNGLSIYDQFDISMQDLLAEIEEVKKSPSTWVHRQLHELLISEQAIQFFSINNSAIPPEEWDALEFEILNFIDFKFSKYQGKPSVYEK